MLDVSEHIFELVHEAFGLGLAQEYCNTTSAGIGTIPSTSQTSSTLHFSYHPKISITWASNPREMTTAMICMADQAKITLLEGLLVQEFAQRLCGHPMAVVVFGIVLFGLEIQETQEELKHQVRQVEVRTGHHDWKSRNEPPALGDLLALAAKMSGCESRVGSCLRKQSMLNEMIDFVEKQCASIELLERNQDSQACRDMSSLILESIEPLKHRTTAQRIDTGFLQGRISTQVDAVSLSVFHCIWRMTVPVQLMLISSKLSRCII
jgi:hypothetical protein